jgi:hypothetical protein
MLTRKQKYCGVNLDAERIHGFLLHQKENISQAIIGQDGKGATFNRS